MKKLLFIFLTSLLIVSCKTDDSSPVVPEGYDSGNNTFVWDPGVKTSRRVTVFLPATISGLPAGTITANDSITGKYQGLDSENRNIYIFERPGSQIGKNIPVVFTRLNLKFEWIIPDGAIKYSERYP